MTDLEKKVADLELRIAALEERSKVRLWGSHDKKEEELITRCGEYVGKTEAAKILGVTRATVYAMLSDGRIEGAYYGKRVSVRSIAHYMTAPKSKNSRISCGNKRKEARNGSDALEEA